MIRNSGPYGVGGQSWSSFSSLTLAATSAPALGLLIFLSMARMIPFLSM
jgi:hypothetical protein